VLVLPSILSTQVTRLFEVELRVLTTWQYRSLLSPLLICRHRYSGCGPVSAIVSVLGGSGLIVINLALQDMELNIEGPCY
jgi:hypothetical protein